MFLHSIARRGKEAATNLGGSLSVAIAVEKYICDGLEMVPNVGISGIREEMSVLQNSTNSQTDIIPIWKGYHDEC